MSAARQRFERRLYANRTAKIGRRIYCASGGDRKHRVRVAGIFIVGEGRRAVTASPQWRPFAGLGRGYAAGFFFMCTLRTEILRTVNRPRTAPTVRLSLSAIIVGLFPASTISRNRLSSSGSQRRLRALIPPAVSPGVVSFDQAHGRFRAYRVRLADVPRFASRRVVPARYIPQGSAWRPQWHVSVSPGLGFLYPGTQLTRTGNQ